MPDPRTENLAHTLIDYCTAVKPGDWALVVADIAAEPLAEQVVKYAVRAGANVNTIFDSELISTAYFREASPAQLEWISPYDELLRNKADVVFFLEAARNTRAFSGIDPEKMRIRGAARKDLMTGFLKRIADKELRMVISLYPTFADAQEADMGLHEFEDFVYRAVYADHQDPLAEWQRIHGEQQRWVDWLRGKKQVHVQGPHADLTLSVEGRLFDNESGKENMPGGEVYTCPVEDSAEGWVEFTYPAIFGGREVEDVRLEFENGRVVQASAQKGQDFLLEMLDMDAGARYLGEFAIGTNYGIPNFTKNILFDEKIGGTFHLALGAAFPELGGVNESALHWDMICDARQDTEITVDDELFYKDGQFQV